MWRVSFEKAKLSGNPKVFLILIFERLSESAGLKLFSNKVKKYFQIFVTDAVSDSLEWN